MVKAVELSLHVAVAFPVGDDGDLPHQLPHSNPLVKLN